MAVRVVLVRHAEPAGAYGGVADPGLSAAGEEQAQATAMALDRAAAGSLVLSSPLRRARATAAALEAPWLRWSDVGGVVATWRDGLVGTLLALPEYAVAFTHFVAINAAVGAATGDERLACCSPGYCSRTMLQVRGDELTLVELGAQTRTVVR